MSRRRMPLMAIMVAACALFGFESKIQAQSDVNERLSMLEREVNALRNANKDLKDTIANMNAMGAGDNTELAQRLDALEQGAGGMGGGGDYVQRSPGVSNVSIFGEARTRFDFRSNTGDLRDDIDDEGLRLDFRFNLGFQFTFDTAAADVTTFIEIQSAGRGSNNTAEDVSANIAGAGAGGFESRTNELDEVRLYQAYILLERIFNVEELSLKFGRQRLKYGSQLILGENAFFTGTTHDAIRVDYEAQDGSYALSFFYSKQGAADGQSPSTTSSGGLFTGRFRASGDEDEMLGLYTTFDLEGIDPVQFDVYWVYFNARSASRTSPGVNLTPNNVTAAADPGIDSFGRSVIGGRHHTIGTFVRAEDIFTDGLYISAEVAYQFGSDEADQDLDAFIVEFAAEYELLPDIEGKVYVRYYFAEGADNGESQGFTPLFNSRHDNDPYNNHGAFSRLGNIDFIPASNVHVFQIGFKFSPAEKWILGITYLFAMLDESEQALTFVPNGALFADDAELGHEVDLYARYDMSENTVFFFNFSVFIPTFDFFEANPGATGIPVGGQGFRAIDSDVAVGAYAQIRVTF